MSNSKYHAVRTAFNGKVYASALEARWAAILPRLPGVVKVEEQFVIYIIPPCHEVPRGVKYIADFRVTFYDGTIRYFDAKGFKTAVYTLKKKLVKYFCGIEIEELGKSMKGG